MDEVLVAIAVDHSICTIRRRSIQNFRWEERERERERAREMERSDGNENETTWQQELDALRHWFRNWATRSLPLRASPNFARKPGRGDVCTPSSAQRANPQNIASEELRKIHAIGPREHV